VRAPDGTLTTTAEQQAAIDAFATGATVVIEAGAGTGKTSALRLLAAVRPQARGLYVAYNKAIQVEAERSFGRNVEARTAHSFAYRAFGAPMRHRLNGPRVTSRDTATLLKAPSVPLGGDVVADEAITARHFPWPEAPESTDLAGLSATVVGADRRAWADLTSTSGRLKPSYDVYLKLWQLSQPHLRYDFVLVVEAQDADPAVADVIVHQDAQLVAVGDSAQAIYGWRGATDFLERAPADQRVELTQSWRFGPAVAEDLRHKAKGREWDQVLVAEDFREPKPDPVTGDAGPIPAADAMLAYVTVTRAMGRLDNAGLAWVHSHPAVNPRHGEATVHGRAVAAEVEAPTPGVDCAEEPWHSETAISVRAQAPAASHPASRSCRPPAP
jgi:hypothetical protein